MMLVIDTTSFLIYIDGEKETILFDTTKKGLGTLRGQKPRIEFAAGEFRKSSFSHGGKKVCVQVAMRPEGVGVRDSKDPTKTTLHFSPEEWKAFLDGVRNGEFDQ